MRKILLLLILILTSFESLLCQNKSDRRIYLWDVTLSMKGFNGNTPDIYDKIVKFLENEIKSISDESTEIVVCPFQESILDTWIANASDAGKQKIIAKIKAYNNNKRTGTNIAVPIQFVQNNLIKHDKHNLLILLTDGQQTGGNASLLQLISKWGKYGDLNDAFALYVMLTEEAICQDIIDTINKTDNIEVVTEPGQAVMIDLKPSNPIKVNLKNDKTASISFNFKKGVTLPSDINIQVYSKNQYLTINQKATLEDSKISFAINYKKDYNTLKTQLPETTKIPLKISIANRDELKRGGKIIYLTKENLTLELINKPEKTLKISIKKK